MAGNYRYISEEQKRLVLTMSLRGMTAKAIKDATGICERSTYRVRSTWNSSGQVVRHSLNHGRPRALTALEVLVCYDPNFQPFFFDALIAVVDKFIYLVSGESRWAKTRYIRERVEICSLCHLWYRDWHNHHHQSIVSAGIYKEEGEPVVIGWYM